MLKKIKEIPKSISNLFRKTTKKTKAIIASVLVVTVGLGSLVSCNLSKKKKNNDSAEASKTTVSDTIQSTSLSDLGVELPLPTKETAKKEYANPTGKVDTSKIVTGNNGKIYANQEAKDNSSKVGKTTIDTKNDTLVVKPNGEVHQKQEEYEIKDKETGEVIATGKTDENPQVAPNGTVIPNDDYVYDENTNEVVEKEDKETIEKKNYITCDCNFYSEDGTLVIAKGDVISQETYDRAKKELLTTKPNNTETPEEDIVIDETFKPSTEEGVINPDGTYTIFGLTFQSKADYQQWIIQGYEGYGVDIDGIMKPMQAENTNSKELTK